MKQADHSYHNLARTFLVSLLFLFCSTGSLAKERIYFTPLPTENPNTLAKKFLPFIQHIEQTTNQSIEFNLKQDYSDIIQGVIDSKIDLFTLGPLPYLELKKRFPNIEPILLIKRESGKAQYRCMLTKFRLDKPDTKSKLKIALSQPLSTCGYFKTETLVKNTLNKELSEQHFFYAGSHIKAIEAVLAGKADYAGACECYAKKYQTLGMEMVAQSELVPGFGIFANTQTLKPDTVQAIKKAILSLSKEEFKQLGSNIRHGVMELEGGEYEGLTLPAHIPLEGNYSP